MEVRQEQEANVRHAINSISSSSSSSPWGFKLNAHSNPRAVKLLREWRQRATASRIARCDIHRAIIEIFAVWLDENRRGPRVLPATYDHVRSIQRAEQLWWPVFCGGDIHIGPRWFLSSFSRVPPHHLSSSTLPRTDHGSRSCRLP